MKRDLRLSHDRSNVSRSDYIKETEQTTIVGDLSITEMKFDNCLDQVEGELSYRNAKAEHYEEYLNDKKEKSNGNLWRYLRDVQNLYEGSHLSKQARTWNLELLEQLKQNFLSILMEEKDILDKEKSADPSYYERYYRREGEALERCLSFLSRK